RRSDRARRRTRPGVPRSQRADEEGPARRRRPRGGSDGVAPPGAHRETGSHRRARGAGGRRRSRARAVIYSPPSHGSLVLDFGFGAGFLTAPRVARVGLSSAGASALTAAADSGFAKPSFARSSASAFC